MICPCSAKFADGPHLPAGLSSRFQKLVHSGLLSMTVINNTGSASSPGIVGRIASIPVS
jgi:hypothetical protein